MNRMRRTTITLLAALVALQLAPTAVAENRTSECEEALERAEVLIESLDGREEGIRWKISAAAICREVQDPVLRVLGIVAGAWSLGKTRDKRLYLEEEFPEAERAAGSASPALLPILDQLVNYAVLDGCEVGSARAWAERAEAIRSEIALSSEALGVELLTTRGDHAYWLGTCYRQRNEVGAAKREFEKSESAFRQAYAEQLVLGTSDEERFETIDKLRITVEEMGRSLETDLAYEHQQLSYRPH